MIAIASAGLDYQLWSQQRARLQEFADTLALRGAREFMLANARADQIENLVRSIAESDLPDDLAIGAFTINVAASAADASVTVSLAQPARNALILSHFSPFGDDIVASAEAVARGGMKVCVVALDDAGPRAIATSGQALLDAEPCSVLSNSTSTAGVEATGGSRIVASLICSAGGALGPSANFDPAATTDCPPYPDPLATREPPPVGACDYNNFQIGHVTGLLTALPLIEATVSPGVYCGGLKIAKLADVAFEPGIYVIKDGPLEVGAGSTLDGENVAFYLLGDAATFHFEPLASIAMSAPRDGPLAGVMFFEDRNAPPNRVHLIESEDAREFLGTFYLPRGVLRVDSINPIADASAYTAIIARRIELAGSPTLVLNADYGATDVPVPDGVGPVGGEVFLRD